MECYKIVCLNRHNKFIKKHEYFWKSNTPKMPWIHALSCYQQPVPQNPLTEDNRSMWPYFINQLVNNITHVGLSAILNVCCSLSMYIIRLQLLFDLANENILVISNKSPQHLSCVHHRVIFVTYFSWPIVVLEYLVTGCRAQSLSPDGKS